MFAGWYHSGSVKKVVSTLADMPTMRSGCSAIWGGGQEGTRSLIPSREEYLGLVRHAPHLGALHRKISSKRTYGNTL